MKIKPILVMLYASLILSGPTSAQISADRSTATLSTVTPSTIAAPHKFRTVTNWLQQFSQQLQQWEYRPGKNAEGVLQAPNRVHHVRTYFDGKGIRVHKRTSGNSDPLLALSLSGFGRGNIFMPIQPGEVVATEEQVEIRHPGLVEWYKNSPRGLEQGFNVKNRLPGTGPLVLDLKIDFARAHLKGQTVELTSDQGRQFHYSKLEVVDASGKVLASRFALPSPQHLQLVIDDSNSRYPLVIDPLLTNVADKRLESDVEDSSVGFNTNAFGAKVGPAGDVNGDGFADIMIGAPLWDGGEAREGAVFIFLGSASGIVGNNPASAHAMIESNQVAAQLGSLPCSVTGDVNNDGFDDIVVGARFYKDVLPGTSLQVDGAAFVFLGSAAGITATGPVNANAYIRSIEKLGEMGRFISGAGDVNNDGFADIIVGTPRLGTPFPPNIPANDRSGNYGAALIFHGGPSGITGTGFSDANTVIMSFADTGPEPVIYGQIGNVCGAGDVDNDGFDDVFLGGTEASLFTGSATGITGTDLTQAHTRIFATPALPIVDSRGGAGTGFVVARAGDINGDGFTDLLASIPFRDADPLSADFAEGAFYTYHGASAGLIVAPQTSYIGVQGAEYLGNTLAGIGDIDNDGFADVAIGARIFPGSLDSEGIAYIMRGSPAGLAPSLADAYTRITSGQSDAVLLGNRFGMSVNAAGDINADGFDDVLFGTAYYDGGEINEGAAFVYHGGAVPASVNLPPVSVAGSDQTVIDVANTNNATITVDGGASFDPDGSIVAYEWREGGTVLGTLPILTTSLPATGRHQLALNVTDNQGLTRGDLVNIRVNPVATTTAASDTFVSGDFSGGTGWSSSWLIMGSVSLVSISSFPSPPQVQMDSGVSTLTRTITLPAGATGLGVKFWAKMDLFASNDMLEVQISHDGGPYTTVRTFTTDENVSGYLFYGGSGLGGAITLSWYPATAATATIRFQLTSSNGVFSVDDIATRALLVPAGTPIPPSNLIPSAAAGNDISIDDADGDGFEMVALDGSLSVDSDGTVVSYQWYDSVSLALLGTGVNLTAAFDTGTHTVQLVVTDNNGATKNDTLTVTVVEVPVPPPVVNSFTATPTIIAPGGTVTLDWTTTYATTVSISGVSAPLMPDGSIVVSPPVTTTYSLTATGNSGVSIDSITVTVTPTGIAGDINGDGVVDVVDVLLAVRAALGLYTLTSAQFQRADIAPLAGGVSSPDGLFNAADLLLIQRKAIENVTF